MTIETWDQRIEREEYEREEEEAEKERKRKFMEARNGSVKRELTVPLLSKRLKDEEIKTVIKCNERIMGYFEDEVRRRRNTYKPKLKATLEHQNDIGKLFKNLLMETQEAA